MNASPPASLAATTFAELLLVGIGELVGVEIGGHRSDHLPGHLQLRCTDLDLLVEAWEKVGLSDPSGHNSV